MGVGSRFRWPSHPHNLFQLVGGLAVAILQDESLEEEFALIVIKVVAYGMKLRLMMLRKPDEIFHVVATLAVIEGSQLIANHGRDVIHGDLSTPDSEHFDTGPGGAAEST